MIVLLAGVLLMPHAAAQVCDLVERTKLRAGEGSPGDFFGSTVAIDGDVAVVGARDQDARGPDSGAVHVFHFNGEVWSEQQVLLASDAAEGDKFGRWVAVNGDVIVVGAHHDDDAGTSSGAAYVYRHDGNTWMEEQKLVASDAQAGAEFGCAVSVCREWIVVGAQRDDQGGESAGAAYVFRHDGIRWTEAEKLVAGDASPMGGFGNALSLSGDAVLIGASAATSAEPGSAYVYRFDGASWNEERLEASDLEDGDQFGCSVNLDGDLAVVGASRKDSGAGVDSGVAYVFRFDGTSWVEEQRLSASDGQPYDRFGRSEAVDGDLLLVGARGDDDRGESAGAAYVFHHDGGEWREVEKLTAADGEAGDEFGRVALAGSNALIGARGDDDRGSRAGAAYIFSPLACLTGTVNTGAGEVAEVLTVNGQTGGCDRTAEVDEEAAIRVAIVLPPKGGGGRFVLHGNFGRPDVATERVLPSQAGRFCFPLLLGTGATPDLVCNNLRKYEHLGRSRYLDGAPILDPQRAPTVVLDLAGGDPVYLPSGTVLSLQAVLLDPGSESPRGASASNAVLLVIR